MAAEDERVENRGSLAERTYENLRFAIVRGELRPNERLIEVDLAARFQVSRTPVRESLQRLAVDGLVVPARRGWVVRELALDEIREIYEVREALEGRAAALAAERATAQERESILGLVAHRHVSPGENRTGGAKMVYDNDAFHTAVINACGNRRLVGQIERNVDYYYNVQVASLYNDAELATSLQQHSEIARAIANGDPETAELIMRRHIRDALAVILEHSSPAPRLFDESGSSRVGPAT